MVFYGLAFLLVSGAITYLFFQFARIYKTYADKEERYNLLEIGFLRKIAKKHDINLEKEKLETQMFERRTTVRHELQEMIKKEYLHVLSGVSDDDDDDDDGVSDDDDGGVF